MVLTDTIAAIATPLGEGGLAVIRLSGSQAVAVAERCFTPAGRHKVALAEVPTHTVHYGQVRRRGAVIDEVLLSVLRSPRTLTREDVVEISCHGGLVVARAVLDTVLASGARMAQPGEFTLRAFLNGRIDLAQAEAVADVIHARTDLALKAAQEQLAGKLSAKVEGLRDDLLDVLAHLEAHIDFPEEDIAPNSRRQLLHRLEHAVKLVGQLLDTAREGEVLRQGIRAAIVGQPNVGKSSLLNQLLGHERAIVSPQPGTTRDTIESMANVRGIPVLLVDTAGLRASEDAVEQEGVRRSRGSLESADLVLHVLDSSQALSSDDQQRLEQWRDRKRVVIGNKSDLPKRLDLPDELAQECVWLSALTGKGVPELFEVIAAKVWGGEIRADMTEVMINARHREALSRAQGALGEAESALRIGYPLELVAADLRVGVNAVGEVVGKTTTDDLLDRIFSRFCLGK